MPIRYLAGDLFLNENEAKAFAQGCNIEGVMNTQISLAFRDRYPAMFLEYERRCLADPPELNLGDVFLWEARDGKWVFNLAVHENKFYKIASRKMLDRAFREMRRLADEHEIDSIAMPPIGAGMGALYWGKARSTLERAFRGWKGVLYVYVKQPRITPRDGDKDAN